MTKAFWIAAVCLLASGVAFAQQPGAELTGCTTRVLQSGELCLCGTFPPGSWQWLRIGGFAPTGVIEETEQSLRVQIPNLAPGAHLVSMEVGSGFSGSDQLMIEVVRIVAAIDREALQRGETAKIELTVEGTEAPVALQVTNTNPGIVRLSGGSGNDNLRETMSSGGEQNRAELEIRALEPGAFNLRYELALGEACTCLEEETLERNPDGFLPIRAVTGIPLAAQPVMNAAAAAIAAANAVNVIEVVPLNSAGIGMAVFGIPDARTVPVVVAALAATPGVLFAQPDFQYETSQGAAAVPGGSLSYGRSMIGADRLPGNATGAGVRVAIIDTGIDPDHAALQGRIAERADYTGNGYAPEAHGTLVAGIIAARRNRIDGFEGIAPEVRILALKACQPYSAQSVRAQCGSSSLAKALDHAIEQRAAVINMSVAGRADDSLLSRLLAAAFGGIEGSVKTAQNRSIVIAAAGNDGPGSDPPFPASLEGVIAVTAVDASSAIYPHATRGLFIDLAAPGVQVISTAPGNQYPVTSGTSFATAYATATAAILLQQNPSLTPAQLRTYLEESTRDLGAPGRDADFGAGLLDACAAFARVSREGCN